MDWRLFPSSAGFRESNDCHNPAGPNGGQFCSGGFMNTEPGLSKYAKVAQTLSKAGLKPGRFKRAGVTVPDGYQAGEPGFVVDSRQDFEHPAGPALVYVDHIGPKREAALAKYKSLLKAAGLDSTLGRVKHYSKKTVLWVGKVPDYEPPDRD